MIWGRFCQPCSILYSESSDITKRILIARENSVRHMASQITPLFSGPIKSSEFWAKGFYESYKTELRPESSEKRAIEIVERYENRYSRITTVLFGKPNEDGYYAIPQETKIYAKFFRKKTSCNMLTHYGLETMEKGGIQVNNFNLDF